MATTAAPRVIRGPQVETAERGRFYVWQGQRYWSVTTIINGGIPKPALIGWAKKFTAEYAVEHLSTLQVLAADDPAGAVDWLKGAAFRDRDRRANLGSLVHEAAEAHVLGQPYPEWSKQQAPYMQSFLAWLEDFQPTFIAVEAPVFSRSQMYAGTLDAIVEFEHPALARRWGLPQDRPITLLVDYKTGSGIYAEVGLQLAAYRYADTFIGLPDADEAPMPEVDACAAVHLTPEGYSFLRVTADEAMFRAFLYCREVYRWSLEQQPGAVGPTISPPKAPTLEGVS